LANYRWRASARFFALRSEVNMWTQRYNGTPTE